MACSRKPLRPSSLRGFKSPSFTPCDVARHRQGPNPRVGFGPWSFLGLVAACWVEGEVSEELAGGGVDDADVEVVDESDDGLSGVGAADADVVHAAGSAERDGAAVVDAVAADPVVGACVRAGRRGLGEALVGGAGVARSRLRWGRSRL